MAEPHSDQEKSKILQLEDAETVKAESVIQTLIEAGRLFYSHEAYKTFSEVYNNGNLLRQQSNDSIDRIRSLTADIDRLKAEHQAELSRRDDVHQEAYREVLRAHQSSLGIVGSEKADLEKRLLTAKEELAAIQHDRGQLQDQIFKLKAAGKSTIEKLKSERERMRALDEERESIGRDLRTKEKAFLELELRFRKGEEQRLVLNGAFTKLQGDKSAVATKLEDAQRELTKWNGFLEEMHDREVVELSGDSSKSAALY